MTTSPNLGLNLQTTGSNNGTWGNILNGSLSIIDSRMGARTSVNCAGSSNITVSATDAQNFFQTLTGVLTGNIKYILPAQGGYYFITNNTTGAFTLTVVNDAAGSGVVLTQGASQLVMSNPDNTTVYSIIPGSFGATTFTGQITSTVTTGTAPLVIASTTKVSNLYVDRAALADTVTTNANLTGDITSVGNATTLPTVNSNVGSFINSSITVNAKGQITAASSGSFSGISSVKQQIFTGNGTYTPSAGMVYCKAEAVGAGAGGGGTVAATGAATGAGGGGSGAYSSAILTAAQIGASKPVTIGSAGTAGNGFGASGGNGGDTSLGSLVVAKGGLGGTGCTAASDKGKPGGLGGDSASGTGDLKVSGAPGGYGFGASIQTTNAMGGYGGNSVLGGGGQQVAVASSGSISGVNGTAPGAAGSGGASVSSGTANGGAGNAGLLIITEYCS